jgi:hypothetical protein
MEFLCPLCHEWYNTDMSKSHYEGTHGQTGMDIESLKRRMEWLGGLDVREELPPPDEEDPKRIFQTNNFRHHF